MRSTQSPRASIPTIEEFERRLLYSKYVVSGAADGEGTVKPSGDDTYAATTLRAAITAANAKPGADVVRISPKVTGRITVELGELVITQDLTIRGVGADAQVIRGNSAARVFNVRPGVTVSIVDVTVTHGESQSTAGGGIRSEGALTLLRVTVRGNHAIDADGGGLFNLGTLTVIDSTFSNNSAVSGGGLFNGGTATVVNSTFAGNLATDFGGGLYNRDGANLRLDSSTVSGNRAGHGGGIASTLDDPINSPPGTRLFNTVVAGNTFDPTMTESQQSPLGPDMYGFFDATSANNLVGSLGFAKGMDATRNLLGSIENLTPKIDPLLSPLDFYGGTTRTMRPRAGSPMIDAGNNALVPTGVVTDQRGNPRVAGVRVDIGSVEVVPRAADKGTTTAKGEDPDKDTYETGDRKEWKETLEARKAIERERSALVQDVLTARLGGLDDALSVARPGRAG